MNSARIATLLASGTEIVCALGLEDRLVAISHECDFPDQVLDRPRVTRTLINPDATSAEIDRQVRDLGAGGQPMYQIDDEKLRQLRPDILITQSHCEVCAISDKDVQQTIARVAELADAHVVSLGPSSLNGLYADIFSVGAAAGVGGRADAFVSSLMRRVDAVRRRSSMMADGDRVRVACIEWTAPLMVAANWMPELIELAGGKSGITTAGHSSAVTDFSELVRFDPEVIVVMPCGFDRARATEEISTLEAEPRWADLSAVRAGRVYPVDGNAYFNRSGPRLVDSLELLADLLYPGS
ncbi:MAG: ABC transporter substrate-binding protein [Planctomycetota bacterium]|jgi:iron complex transport system substrate-binding protein